MLPCERSRPAQQEDLELLSFITRDHSGECHDAAWRGARVTVKIQSAVPSEIDCWRAEVRALSSLHHMNIISLLGLVIEPTITCSVLEAMDGEDARTALNGPTPNGFFIMVATGTAMGMAYLHRRDMLHGDLSTANIFVVRNQLVKLMNFGRSAKLPPGSSSVATFSPRLTRCARGTAADDCSHVGAFLHPASHSPDFDADVAHAKVHGA